MNPDLLPLLIFAAVALLIAAAVLVWRDLLARRGAPREPAEKPVDWAALLPSPETVAAQAERESWLAQLAAQGGSSLTAETTLLLAVLVGLSLGGALFLWQEDWLAGAVGAVFGVLAVGGLLFFLRFRRYRAIREQLPDIMELMARAVRAGESLDQAIALASDSNFRPMAAEFRYCARQMKMGLSLESALRSLVGRTPLAETRILAMTLVVQRRRGGNLPNTLERLARVFRDRSNFHRQFQAATAMGRGSAALIALIALGLDAAVLMGHWDYAANLLTNPNGRIMLVTAVALQVVGMTWLFWLFRSDF